MQVSVSRIAESKWITTLQQSVPSGSVARLIVFPYAGSGPSAFRLWSKLFPADVEILSAHLPGRETRIFEPVQTDIDVVADQLATAILKLPFAPTIFFGHSLGALIAYEVSSRLLKRDRRLAPSRLVLSGCSPEESEEREEEGPAWQLSDEAFIEKLRELDGTPEEVLNSRELLDLFLPVLRADFQLAYNARTALNGKLALHAHIFGGIEDLDATEEDLRRWQEYFVTEPELTMFAGGHFFVNDHPRQVCAILESYLASAVSERTYC